MLKSPRPCLRIAQLLLLAGLLLCGSLTASVAAPSAEYRLKAALIYKLTEFIDWPESGQMSQHQSFNICVLGEDNFGEALDALEQKTAHSNPIKIYRFNQSDFIDVSCQILFISDSKKAFAKDILKSFQSEPVLTLGESEQFARHGGMIQFSMEGKRIVFIINDAQAKRANLKIAAPLLQLATIVNSTE